jgi:hypothetical protein
MGLFSQIIIKIKSRIYMEGYGMPGINPMHKTNLNLKPRGQ